MVNNEDSDGSVHSHIFPTSKVPPTTPATPARKRKVQAKKTPSMVSPLTTNPAVLDDLDEGFAPHGPKISPLISPPRVASQVFVFLCFIPTHKLAFRCGF